MAPQSYVRSTLGTGFAPAALALRVLDAGGGVLVAAQPTRTRQRMLAMCLLIVPVIAPRSPSGFRELMAGPEMFAAMDSNARLLTAGSRAHRAAQRGNKKVSGDKVVSRYSENELP